MYDEGVVTPLLHADVDSFFASVVMRRRPDLRDIPMAVVAHVFIASPNYRARAEGIRAGMLVEEALARHPSLVLVDVPRDEVEEVSDALFDLFHEVADEVEPGSLEEAFLRIRGDTWEAAVATGHELRRRAAAELRVALSVGVGRTKLMAKLASRRAKPDGLHVIDAVREAELRTSLPIIEAWGVGGATLERLALLDVATLGDLDGIGSDRLRRVCGTRMARRLKSFRDGTDDSQVRPVSRRSTLTAEMATAGYERRDWTVDEMLTACVNRVCRRASRAGLAAGGITVTLLPAAGVAIRVGRVGEQETADPHVWRRVVDELCAEALPRPVAGVRVSLTRLVPTEWAMTPLF